MSFLSLPVHILLSPHSFPLLSYFNTPHPLAFLSELSQESVPVSTHNTTGLVSTPGVMPYLQCRAGDQNISHSGSTTLPASTPSSSSSCDKQPVPPGTMVSSQLQGQSYSLGMSNSGLGPPPPKHPGGVYSSTSQHSSSEGNSLPNMVSSTNRSCLYRTPQGAQTSFCMASNWTGLANLHSFVLTLLRLIVYERFSRY